MQKYLTPRYLVLAGIVAVIGLAALWYLVSPLFINRRVNEPSPQAQEPPAMKTAMANQVPTKVNETVAGLQTDPNQAPSSPSDSPVLLAQGDFYNVVHEGKGKAEIFRLPTGKMILRLDDFQVLNGPELHVYLVPTLKVEPTIGTDAPAGSADLGKLKGNQGSQNYDIPSSVDLARIRSVVIWCQPFRVPFIAATFQ